MYDIGVFNFIGVPDRLKITSDSRGQYSDQFELRWTVRSTSSLDETLLRLKSVGNLDTRKAPLMQKKERCSAPGFQILDIFMTLSIAEIFALKVGRCPKLGQI